MINGRSSSSASAWPDSTRPRRRAHLAIGAVVIAGALTAALALPSTAYLGRAFVVASDRGASAPSLSDGGADAIVSNPVILRAAASLIEAGVEAPAPDAVEKIGVALGLAGARPTSGEARLALDISHSIQLRADEATGSLRIEATSPDPKNAMQIATAVALAFVADQDELAAKARHRAESDVAARLERLKGEAAAARRRLADLGGIEADPVQDRATAAAQTAAAQARLDTIRTIVASASPPLSDRRDVPPAIETLQSTYLDLSRQLARARETLGDRHTTIISLQDGLRRAAANLTTEWKRLVRIAEQEVQTARARETDLKKALTPADTKRRDAILEARRNVQLADEAFARAQSARDNPLPGVAANLSVRPALSAAPVGYSVLIRGLIALLVGGLVFAVGKLIIWGYATAIRRRMEAATTSEAPERDIGDERARPLAKAEPTVAVRRQPRASSSRSLPEDMTPAMIDLLRGAKPISAQFGGVPTIMVTALEPDLQTTPAAVALGRAAAREGQRVLIVEAGRSQTTLAAAAAVEGEPTLVDFFGTLRIALFTEASGLTIAPSLGGDFAASLARRGETPIVEDLADTFDLIVVDGGLAEECAAAGWGADAYLRVGRRVSTGDDTTLLALFDDPHADLLGHVVGTSVEPARTAAAVQPVSRPETTRRPLVRASHKAVRPASGAIAPMSARDTDRRSRTARR